MNIQILECELLFKFSDVFPLLPQKYGCWNCGFTKHNNEFLFSARNEISKWNQDYFKWDQEPIWEPRAVPVLCKLDEKYNPISIVEVTKSFPYVLSDVRMMIWKNEPYYFGTHRSHKIHPDGKRKVDEFFAKSIGNNLIFLPFTHDLNLPQKNWTPIISNNELFWENFSQRGELIRYLFHYKGTNLKLVRQEATKHNLRGNCQSVDIGDHYLVMYHYHTKRTYWHYFALLSKDFPFPLTKLSSAVRFSTSDTHIQFGMGMEKIDDYIYLSYGVQDSDNHFARVKLEKILDLFV